MWEFLCVLGGVTSIVPACRFPTRLLDIILVSRDSGEKDGTCVALVGCD